MSATVVHVRERKHNVYIGRGSKWGNPFKMDTKKVKADGSREEVIQKYREYILNNKELLAAIPTLEGKILGCWCKPLPCHGDILVELLNLSKTHDLVALTRDELDYALNQQRIDKMTDSETSD